MMGKSVIDDSFDEGRSEVSRSKQRLEDEAQHADVYMAVKMTAVSLAQPIKQPCIFDSNQHPKPCCWNVTSTYSLWTQAEHQTLGEVCHDLCSNQSTGWIEDVIYTLFIWNARQLDTITNSTVSLSFIV